MGWHGVLREPWEDHGWSMHENDLRLRPTPPALLRELPVEPRRRWLYPDDEPQQPYPRRGWEGRAWSEEDWEAPPQAGTLEVLAGRPAWLPPGVHSVYLAVQLDDGAEGSTCAMNESLSDAADGSSLTVECLAATQVTLHLMAERFPPSAGRRLSPLPARSLGSLTHALPEVPPGAIQRLQLTAPLEMQVELVFRAAGSPLTRHEREIAWDNRHHLGRSLEEPPPLPASRYRAW